MRTIKVFTTIEIDDDVIDARLGYGFWGEARVWGKPQLVEVFEGTERTYALKP